MSSFFHPKTTFLHQMSANILPHQGAIGKTNGGILQGIFYHLEYYTNQPG